MINYFPENRNLNTSLVIFNKFHFKNLIPFPGEISQFFRSIAQIGVEALGASVCTIWDNNNQGDTLVLQASWPERNPQLGSFSIACEKSLTGIAIEGEKIIFHERLSGSQNGRSFAHPAIIESLNLKSMISIPVKRLSNPGEISFVINLMFDTATPSECPITLEDMEYIISEMELSLDYLMNKKYREISNFIFEKVPHAPGISALFDEIVNSIKEFVNCEHVTLFLWDKTENFLRTERSTDQQIPPYLERFSILPNYQNWDHRLHKSLIENCVDKAESFVLRENITYKDERLLNSIFSVICPNMAVPILSTEKQVLGVLLCSKHISEHHNGVSFSSLDLRILEKFAWALSPYIDRFIRFSKSGRLLEVFQKVATTVLAATSFDESLENFIRELVNILDGEVGSVYLFEKDSEYLQMKAGFGLNDRLIGKAQYAKGEGLTGEIATGKILNLKTRESIISHPSYIGKYDKEIWRDKPNGYLRTFLGVPIVVKGTILGALKISNIRTTTKHPSPYFTEEDEQIAVIMSSFLATVIENFRLKKEKSNQLLLFAENTPAIIASRTEEDAITTVLNAITDAGYHNSMVSLFDEESNRIKGLLSSGPDWIGLEDTVNFQVTEENALCKVFRSQEAAYISDIKEVTFVFKNSLGNRIKSFYIVPLGLEEEYIGTLQIDFSDKPKIEMDDEMMLKAFGASLSIAISRIRGIRQSMEITNQLISSSRFLVAETLSSMAIHSIRHRLTDIIRTINEKLAKQDVRSNRYLFETFSDWQITLNELIEDVEAPLRFISDKEDRKSQEVIDVKPLVQKAIDTWINYIKTNKCNVNIKHEVHETLCKISSHAFIEILSVLIVNSIQAHAKDIEIKTHNIMDTSHYSTKDETFALDFSDDGIGLSAESNDEIFRPTYTTKPGKFGTGLGLFIARRIAQGSAGNLIVLPKKSGAKGVTFRLTLKIERKA